MKRTASAILIMLLLLCPCAALAQGVAGGALGGALGSMPPVDENIEIPEIDFSLFGAEIDEAIFESETHILQTPDYPVVQYTLTDAGISIELPEYWLVLTRELGGESPLAQMYGMTDAEIRQMMKMMDAQLYAMTNLLGSGQLFVIVVNGTPDVDMRQGAEDLDLEQFVRGFTMFGFNGTILECGLHPMGEAYYTRICFTEKTEGVPAVSVQYATTIDGTQYIVQYVKTNSKELDERTLAQLDTAVASIRFLEAE